MKNPVDNSSPARNDWADTSRWLGIWALLPYVISGIKYYLEKIFDVIFYQTFFLEILVCLLWGIIFGIATLITGIVGIWQIHKSQGMETGTRVAILGIVLGIIGITVNILFVFLVLAAFMRG
jgi:hypothetical protein